MLPVKVVTIEYPRRGVFFGEDPLTMDADLAVRGPVRPAGGRVRDAYHREELIMPYEEKPQSKGLRVVYLILGLIPSAS